MKKLKKIIAGILIFTLFLTLYGCREKTPDETIDKPVKKPIDSEIVNLSENIEFEKVKAEDIDDKFIKTQQDFALELLSAYYTLDKGNVNISPYSLSYCLGIVANGAQSETSKEIESVLMGGMNKSDWTKNIRFLLNENSNFFSQANSVWLNNEFEKVEESFLIESKNYFGANVYEVDFYNHGIEHINNWVKENTKGTIEKVPDIPPNTKLYVADTIYLDMNWRSTHSLHKVKTQEFLSADGSVKNTKMMYSVCSNDNGNYIKGENEEGFIKPLSVDFSFIALMPDENIKIDTYISSLNGEKLRKLLSEVKKINVNSGMPFFEIQSDIIFNDTLNKMGIKKAYDEEVADFSKISKSDKLFLGLTQQKTVINVDLGGVRASAASGQELIYRSLKQPETTVVLNRPFVYIITDKHSIPVFIGVVAKL